MNKYKILKLISAALIIGAIGYGYGAATFTGPDGSDPLINAIREGNVEGVRKLISESADINMPTVTGSTPLIIAVDKQNPDIVKLLLDHKANFEAKGNNGETALFHAVDNLMYGRDKKNSRDIIELLLNAGANINSSSDSKDTIWTLLIKQNNNDIDNIDVVNLFLSKEFDFTLIDHALVYAIINSNPVISDLLIKAGADVNYVDKRGNNLLTYVLKGKINKQIIGQLLDAGIDLEKINAAKDSLNKRLDILKKVDAKYKKSGESTPTVLRELKKNNENIKEAEELIEILNKEDSRRAEVRAKREEIRKIKEATKLQTPFPESLYPVIFDYL